MKNTKIFIILLLVVFIFVRECTYQTRRANLMVIHREVIEQVIQDTSDELYDACEQVIIYTENNCTN